MFGIEKRYKKLIDAVLLQYPYAFYVYGSRARGTHRTSSDLDLCIYTAQVPLLTYGEIRETLNSLFVPFTLDVVCWDRLSDDFKNSIKNDLIVYIPDPYLGAQRIGLSHSISESTPAWPGKKFDLEVEMDFPLLFRVQSVHMSAGIGTHLDAPLHMIPGSDDISSFAKKTLMAPCSIFVAPKVDQDFMLTVEMIQGHERVYGPLAEGTWFLCMTGWGTKSSDPVAYANIDAQGRMRFPRVSVEAAQYLVSKKILGLAVDTLSPDGDGPDYTVHKTLLQAGVCIIENIKFYSQACGYGNMLHVAPLIIEGATESPVHVTLVMQE
ncbi:MAG: hypothetical protein UU47_C0001G0006 [candidate division TM6 bacterium GW2011_GWE2_41_16]|nr:MAG: hypothetical protein UU47_C0001G0006 [candidate division TM6 bacterium GW2011_GWE2_41_16]